MIDIDADEGYRVRVKANYGFPNWAGHTREGTNNVRLTDVRIDPEQIKGWKLEDTEELPVVKQRRERRYIYLSLESSGRRRLLLTTLECNSVLDAHESLIDVVMTYMAPRLPRCEIKGLEVGDICFGSHGDVNLSVIFARFNIVAEIKNAGTETTSVDEFARAVDSVIFSYYQRSPG